MSGRYCPSACEGSSGFRLDADLTILAKLACALKRSASAPC